MDAVIALIKQAHAGDKDAREKLISDNLGLVWSIVRRFEHRGHEREELFQIGCIGLMKAIAAAYSGIPFLASLGIPSYLYKMVPYIATMVVLMFTSKNSQAPRESGIPYDKGQR